MPADSFESTAPWFSMELNLRSVSLKEAADFHSQTDSQHAEKLYGEAESLFCDAQKAWLQTNKSAYKPLTMPGVKPTSNPPNLTQKDRLSLLCELIQTPSHFLAAVDAVKEIAAMLHTKNTMFQGFICDTLKELFVSNEMLPLARPLRAFVQQPLFQLPRDPSERSRALTLWFFEDALKKTFSEVIAHMKDELITKKWISSDSRKLNTLRFLSELLHKVPEDTNAIAGIIINKLGDPNAVISTRCSIILLDFIKKQSNLQQTIVFHLRGLLEHHGSTDKTQKAVIHILNQIVFGYKNQHLPGLVIAVYVELFRKLISAGAIEQRIMNGILTGMKRALPFAAHTKEITKNLEIVFVMASASQLFHNRVSALNLLQFCLDRDSSGFVQRFYRSLYQLIPFDPTHLPQNAQLTMFFSLIHKSLAKTHDVNVVAAFVHRLLQAALVNSAAYACATLMTLSDLHKCNPSIGVALRAKNPEANEAYFRAAGRSKEPHKTHYDVTCRDPQFAHASTEPLWELTRLQHHFHPTVVKFAGCFARGNPIVHVGNPLDDFSLVHFCELFMHKKPQKSVRESISVHQRQKESGLGDEMASGRGSADFRSFVDQYAMQKKRKRVQRAVDGEDIPDKTTPVESANSEEMPSVAQKVSEKPTSRRGLAKYLRFASYDALDDVLLGSANGDGDLEGENDDGVLKAEEKRILSRKQAKIEA